MVLASPPGPLEQQYRHQGSQNSCNVQSWLEVNLAADQSTEPDEHDSGTRGEIRSPKENSTTLSDQFGRLVLDRNNGTSRYVNHRVLTELADQVQDIRDLFDELSSPTPSLEDASTPTSAVDCETTSPFIFGYHSLASSLRSYHPPPTVSYLLLTIFEENVAPILRIIHNSALKDLIQTAATNPEGLDKSSEALIFSVYFAASSSMTEEQCFTQLGETHATLTKRYRFAVEQALARAGFLHTHKLIVVQAAVLFLSCISHPKDAHFVWTMIAVVTRLALGLGLHRDGGHFELGPYETEMRRRTWWYIYLLDVRTSESQATSPQIREGDYNTLLPLNINDDDLSSDLLKTPKERIGFTDMTLTLVRCEILITHRKLMQISDPTLSTQHAILKSRLSMINECRQALNEQYVRHCDLAIPIHWVAATIARVALARLWLVSHFSLMTTDGFQPDLWPQQCDVLILTAIEVLEFVYLLETHENTAKWSWLFQGYVQWQAFAFVLSELCVRPISPLSDRAWLAVNLVYDRWNGPMSHRPGLMMRSLERLRARAAAARAREIDQSQTAIPTRKGSGDTYLADTDMANQTEQLAEDLLAVDTATLEIFRGVVKNIGI
ncbi:transcriptional regulator family: Fungal Specific TF [Penicillium roqueforti]|nr:transcriptional regulator family: Fungal Specific TF [Penicillium roqueforti]KAI3244240.1 transcriptional regulator family: Fungal Specific TF [Penicillium roqueforti]